MEGTPSTGGPEDRYHDHCFEQWYRTLRLRHRHARLLAQGPEDAMDVTDLPVDREDEIDAWIREVSDVAITCAMNMHHLRDWAPHDPTVRSASRRSSTSSATHRTTGGINSSQKRPAPALPFRHVLTTTTSESTTSGCPAT